MNKLRNKLSSEELIVKSEELMKLFLSKLRKNLTYRTSAQLKFLHNFSLLTLGS